MGFGQRSVWAIAVDVAVALPWTLLLNELKTSGRFTAALLVDELATAGIAPEHNRTAL